MGVMNCSRKDCKSIMCDTYIPEIGYMCCECIREYENYLDKSGERPGTEKKIKKSIKKFMAISKGESNDVEMTVNDFFAEHRRKY